MIACLVAAGAGLCGLAAAALLTPALVGPAWLAAYAAWASVVAGALFVLALGHVARARWLARLRRPVEALVGAAPLVALGFVPVVWGAHDLYPWLHGRGIAPHEAHLVAAKAAWLDLGWFVARGALVWVALVVAGERLRALSRRQDRASAADARGLALRSAHTSVGVIMVVLVAVWVGAADWTMSLEPVWYSNVYGVIVAAGGVVGALAALSAWAGLTPVGRRRVPAGLRHPLGTLLFAALCVWAYVHYSQFLVIWIGDRPVENGHYLRRIDSGWEPLSIGLVWGRFALPFTLLLFRRVKSSALGLGLVGAWVLAGHALEATWLVAPVRAEAPGWDVALAFGSAWAAVGGLTGLAAAARARGAAPFPARDPLLAGAGEAPA